MKKLLIALIRFYQRAISSRTPPSCRFIPTCSAYAIEAIERFGVFHGGALAVWRILRCNPFGKSGYDPVPEKKPKSPRPGATGAFGRPNTPDKPEQNGDSAAEKPDKSE